MKLISFIVPVYNGERHIKKCIDSIVSQNIAKSDYEIIAVNDGSTDNSLSVLKKYVNILPLVIITQPNRGLSAARNAALSQVKSKYVSFVDIDDYLTPNVYSIILDTAEKFQTEITAFAYNRIIDNKAILKSRGFEMKEPVDGISWSKEYLGESYMVQMFLFNNDFLFSNKLMFYERVSVWEDFIYTNMSLSKSSKVIYLDIAAYNYVSNPGSLSNTRNINNIKNKIIIIIYFLNKSIREKSLKRKKFYQNRFLLACIYAVNSLTRYVINDKLADYKNKMIKNY